MKRAHVKVAAKYSGVAATLFAIGYALEQAVAFVRSMSDQVDFLIRLVDTTTCK